MANGTCIHAFCTRPDHDQDGDVHEGVPVFVEGVNGMNVSTQVSYRDGDRQPALFLCDVELTPTAVAELAAVLQRHLNQMLAVEPTGSRV